MAEIRAKLTQNRFYVMLFAFVLILSALTWVNPRSAEAVGTGFIKHSATSDLPNMTITCDWGNNNPSQGARKLPRGKANTQLSNCADADGYYVPKGCATRGPISYKGPRWRKISNFTNHTISLRC